jgi:ParB-like nuclease domain
MIQGVMPPPPPPPAPLIQPKPEIKMITIADIKIVDRLRKKPTSIESLTASIGRHGLLHPISVTPDNTLMGGYRRIKAFECLGKTEIPCIVADPTINRTQAEYDENVERADFALEDIAEIYKLVQSSRIGHRSKKEEDVDDDDNKVGKLPTLLFPKGPSDIVTGKIVGHSEQDVNKIVKLVDASKENPELQNSHFGTGPTVPTGGNKNG